MIVWTVYFEFERDDLKNYYYELDKQCANFIDLSIDMRLKYLVRNSLDDCLKNEKIEIKENKLNVLSVLVLKRNEKHALKFDDNSINEINNLNYEVLFHSYVLKNEKDVLKKYNIFKHKLLRFYRDLFKDENIFISDDMAIFRHQGLS